MERGRPLFCFVLFFFFEEEGRSLLHEHTSGFGTLHVELAGLLGDGAETAEEEGDQISNARASNAVLFSDLASDND
jgi:hypothetical protein